MNASRISSPRVGPRASSVGVRPLQQPTGRDGNRLFCGLSNDVVTLGSHHGVLRQPLRRSPSGTHCCSSAPFPGLGPPRSLLPSRRPPCASPPVCALDAWQFGPVRPPPLDQDLSGRDRLQGPSG